MSEEPNVPQSTVYVGRLVRVITDAIHIAFFLCNNFVGKTTKPLVKDLLRQIIPTAYSFGKSDWVFYTISSDRSRGICACGRFCIPCRHDYLQSWHCVEINKSLSLAPPIFGSERGDIVQPLISNFNISIDEKFSVIIDFDLSPIEYVDIEKGDEDTEVLSEQFSNIRINRTPFKIRQQKIAQEVGNSESIREDLQLPSVDQPIVHPAVTQKLFQPQLNNFVNQEFAQSQRNPPRTQSSDSPTIRQALLNPLLVHASVSSRDCLPPIQNQARPPINLQPPLSSSRDFLQPADCKCASCVIAARNLRCGVNAPVAEASIKATSKSEPQFFTPPINLRQFRPQHYRNYQPQLLINPEHPIGCFNTSAGLSQHTESNSGQITHPLKSKIPSARSVRRLQSRGNPKFRINSSTYSSPSQDINLPQFFNTSLGPAHQKPVAQPQLISGSQLRLNSPNTLFASKPESTQRILDSGLDISASLISSSLANRASNVLFDISKSTPTNHQISDLIDLPERLNRLTNENLTREQLMFIEGTSTDIPSVVQQISIPETNTKNLSPTVPIRLEYVILPETAKSNKTYCFFPPSGSLFLTTFHEFHAGKVDRHKISYTPQKGTPPKDTDTSPFADKVHIISDVRYGNLLSKATNTPIDNNKAKIKDCTCVYCK